MSSSGTRTGRPAVVGAVVGAAVLTAALLIGTFLVFSPDPAPSAPAADSAVVASTTEPAATAPDAAAAAKAPNVFAAVPAEVGLAAQRDADGFEVTVTSDASPDAAWLLPMCAAAAGESAPTAALTTLETGPEYVRSWQVAVLPDTAAAVAVLAGVRAAMDGCADEVAAAATSGVPDRTLLGELATGDDSLLAVARPAGTSVDSESRTYLGAVRVGNAVVLVAESSEFAGEPTADDYGSAAVRADIAELVAGLCGAGSERCMAPAAP